MTLECRLAEERMSATDFRSLNILECLGVPFGHSLIPTVQG